MIIRKQWRRLYDHLAGLTDYSEEKYRVRHKSGEWRWVLSRGKVVEHDRMATIKNDRDL